MQRNGLITTFLRVGYLVLGGWLCALGMTGYFDWHAPVIIWILHLAVMIAGIVFLFSLFAVSRIELPGMIFLSLFLLTLGVVPFETSIRFGSDNLIGIMIWGASLLAGCLIPAGLAGKPWGDRLSLAFLSVWLIVWPIPAFIGGRNVALLFRAFLPALVGLIILINGLIILFRPRPAVDKSG